MPEDQQSPSQTSLLNESQTIPIEPEEDTESTLSFKDMNLSRPTLKALSETLHWEKPTKIQTTAIPAALLGRDICGAAVTGSGKTGAFLIPILERLVYRNDKDPQTRVLVILPTRELAMQCFEVTELLTKYANVKVAMAVGGLSLKNQEMILQTRPDIVIATPGRLIDHVTNSRTFTLDYVEILVLDEADRMLDIGFTDELNEIISKCPKKRQTMLFSATMTENVNDLIRLSLVNPVQLFVDSASTLASKLTQEFIRIRENHEKDREAVILSLCTSVYCKRVILFFPSKQLAHRMRIIFALSGLACAELHGNLSQEQRIHSLSQFKEGKVEYLLCTDIAARGLDVVGVKTVINYSMPSDYKTYLHRVGRTARAGQEGIAVTLVGEADRKNMKEAVKNSDYPSKQRTIPLERLKAFSRAVEQMAAKVETVLQREQEERLLEKAEMEHKKATNLVECKDEIKARAPRTWFQTEDDKKRLKNESRRQFKAAVKEK